MPLSQSDLCLCRREWVFDAREKNPNILCNRAVAEEELPSSNPSMKAGQSPRLKHPIFDFLGRLDPSLLFELQSAPVLSVPAQGPWQFSPPPRANLDLHEDDAIVLVVWPRRRFRASHGGAVLPANFGRRPFVPSPLLRDLAHPTPYVLAEVTRLDSNGISLESHCHESVPAFSAVFRSVDYTVF